MIKKVLKTPFIKMLTSVLIIFALCVPTTFSFTANAVDLGDGIQRIVDTVVPELKSAITPVFTIVTLICLVITVFFLIKTLASQRRGENVSWTPVIFCGIGTIVASIFTGASVFSWFGV